MNKQEMKKIISNEFGFAMNKIVLLEASKTYDKYDYIMFMVCNIEYQMNYSFIDREYRLTIYTKYN